MWGRTFFEAKLSLEAATGGKNTLIRDDLGYPSVMVKIPKFLISEVIDGGPATVHPAFIIDGVEKEYIYISKYLNDVEYDRAYSLPGRVPKNYITYDQAVEYCNNKGSNWHLMTNAEWAAIALWCKKNATKPRGNNNSGKDINNALERGVLAGDSTLRTLTGSGPNSWNHNWEPEGITDLNGNVNEWVSGFRIKKGEIQVIENNNAAINGTDVSSSSALWKGILQDGSLVTPGTTGTLKFDGSTAGDATQTDHYISSTSIFNTVVNNPNYTGADTDVNYAHTYNAFGSITAANGVTIPTILKTLAIAPDGTTYNERLYVRNYGERLPLRGGTWGNTTVAGAFNLHLHYARSFSYASVGFRSAFYD